MRFYTLKTVCGDQAIAEDKIEIKEGSILIQKLPTNEYGNPIFNRESSQRSHDNMKNVLDSSGTRLITILDNIQFQVLEVK